MKHTFAAGLLFSLFSGAAMAGTFSVTVTNNLSEELFAPIVVTDVANDGFFFAGNYVTAEAEEQILTGDPARVVAAIGENMATVGHGMDGPPGVLLAPGASVTFDVMTDATALRILAMVAPTMVPDNYVSAVANVYGADSVTVSLDRFDIGNDEGKNMSMKTGNSVGTVKIVRK